MLTADTKREQWRLRRQRYIASLTPEQLTDLYRKNAERRSKKRAELALRDGRIPGKSGIRKLSPEEKKIANKAKAARYRENNLEKVRLRDAQEQKRKRAIKAVNEGRKPGRIGREARLTDRQRLVNKRTSAIAYWINNPEKRILLSKSCYESNKEEFIIKARNRRAKKKGNGGKHNAQDIKQLWFLQKGKCTWCLHKLGDKKPHVDHRIPIALGGSNNKSNLQLLHASCNKKKAAKHPVEYGLQYGLLAW